MKTIFARLYAVWFILSFGVTLILVAIPTAICHYTLKDDKRRTMAILKWYRIWMKVFMTLVFCRIKRKGRSHFRKGENYVVVCNHRTFFDILVSTPGVPGASKTLAKAELAKIPIFGFVYSSGSILVDRKSSRSRADSVKAMKETLAKGMHLVLYPEGTRNKTSAPLKSFHDGAFNLAIENQKPIIPALIFNTKKILPPEKKLYAWPHTVEMHFLEPVSVSGLSHTDVTELKERVYRLMEKYYLENASD